MHRLQKLLFVYLLIMHCGTMNAQQRNRPKLTALVFMLRVSTNRIESYKDKNMLREMNDAIQADNEINSSIIRDFKNNFSFCPVYFFYDTLLDYVKGKKWDKVIFYDYEHLQSPKKIEVSDLENYLIAEVNYPPMSTYPIVDEKGVVHEPEYEIDFASARDYGILMYDEHFNLLHNKMQFTNISLRRKGSIFDPKNATYSFEGASRFQLKLKKFYCR